MVEDRLGLGAADVVDEHRPSDRDGVMALLLGRVDLGVRHGPEHVRHRLGERSERREARCPASVSPA